MKFTLEVGSTERHVIEFSFNQLFGTSLLKVDGREVFRKKRWFSEPIADNYELEIGGDEQIRLRIEKQRKHLVSSKYKIYVDNRLTKLYQGV
jgi:hypothetical protein